jgi:CDP-diacylglycerol--serine O-phosphatidyltransferase
MLMAFAFEADWPRIWALNALVLVAVSFLMVSHIPTFSIKTVVVRIRPEWVLPTLVGVGVFVAALSSAPWHTLLALGAIYLASLPVGWWSAWRLSRRDAAASAAIVPSESTAPRIVHLGGERDERESSRSKAR